MSGQWEVVGKKKDKASKLPVARNNNSSTKIKKNVVNDLKIEDVCKFLCYNLLLLILIAYIKYF